MTEILWHGRGGQGAFTAAKFFGASYALSSDNYALSFPSFGPERRGAPILAFTKLDTKPIGNRSQIKKADYVVFLDDSLFTSASLKEVKPNGTILINSQQSVAQFQKDNSSKINILTFDGSALAKEILNLNVANTAMAALLAKISGIVSEEELSNALKIYMSEKVAAKNALLIHAVFENGGK